jgi:hypothetical protein
VRANWYLSSARSRPAALRRERRIAEQPADRRRAPFGVTPRKEQTLPLVPHDLAVAADGGHDRRKPARHRLQQRQRRRFAQRGEGEGVRGAHQVGDVGADAQEPHAA